MSKTTNRIFIQYLDESFKKITLTFRSEESLQEHLQQYKISESELSYKSTISPSCKWSQPSASSIHDAIYSFESSYGRQEEFSIV